MEIFIVYGRAGARSISRCFDTSDNAHAWADIMRRDGVKIDAISLGRIAIRADGTVGIASPTGAGVQPFA